METSTIEKPRNYWKWATFFVGFLFLISVTFDISQNNSPPIKNEKITPPSTAITVTPTTSDASTSETINLISAHILYEQFILPAPWQVIRYGIDTDSRVFRSDNFQLTNSCVSEYCVIFDNKKYRDTAPERHSRSLLIDNGRIWGYVFGFSIHNEKTNNNFFDEKDTGVIEANFLTLLNKKFPPSPTNAECGPGNFHEPVREFVHPLYKAAVKTSYPVCGWETDNKRDATNSYYLLLENNSIIQINVHYNREDNTILSEMNKLESAIRKINITISQNPEVLQ